MQNKFEHHLEITSEVHEHSFLVKKMPVKRRIRHVWQGSLLFLLSAITFVTLAFVIGYLLVYGSIYLTEQKVSIFSTNYDPKDLANSGAGAFIITSLILAAMTILFAIPLALITAIFVALYGLRRWWNHGIRLLLNVFNSTPSIIFGIIGMYLFVITWRLGNTGFSLMAGIITLTLVVLPTMTLAMIQALEGVEIQWIYSSFALGASRVNNLFKIILPTALPGIITGIMLSFGRVLSESAPVFLTIGSSYFAPVGLFDQGRSLTTEIFILITQIGSVSAQHFALICGLITLLLLLGFNLTIRFLLFTFKKRRRVKNFFFAKFALKRYKSSYR